MKTGYFGVHLFFAISGFVLTNQILNNDKFSYKIYLFKRLKRIEPPFLIAIIIQGVLLAYILKPQMREEIFSNIKAVLLYLSNFTGKNIINGVTWSLEVEVQFYLILPLLLWRPILFKQVPLVLFAFLLVSYIFKFPIRSVLQDFPYFLAGISVAFNKYHQLLKIKEVNNKFIVWVFLLLLFAINHKQLHIPFLREIRVIMLFLLLNNFLGYRLNGVRSFVFNNWIVRIGGMCYSIYLWHIPIFSVLIMLFSKFQLNFPGGIVLFVVIVIFTMLLSIPFYLMFEKPFMSKRLK
jgi:peptidoglycan/LPS O-acetylase OafA/YrhL